MGDVVGEVSSYNEWDPLEECVVGVCSDCAVGYWTDLFFPHTGPLRPKKRSPDLLAAVTSELQGVADALKHEGVKVVRPDKIDVLTKWSTPDFEEAGSAGAVNPRDLLLIVGSEIIEANMGARGRFFEYRPYRNLVQNYWKQGARWTAAPKPCASDNLYEFSFGGNEIFSNLAALLKKRHQVEEYPEWLDKAHADNECFGLTEAEPVFDAADFTRFGKDIFGNRSMMTNLGGIEWLRRHLEPEYRVHTLAFRDACPVHMDATFVPIRPGLVIASPERYPKDTKLFTMNDWRILNAPPPCHHEFASRWYHINVLMLDERRVLVNEKETDMIKFLETQGCKPIPLPILNCNKHGGGFHCVTSDIRRRGTLASYFPSLDASD